MLGSCEAICFVPAKRPDLARDFYENILGLRFIADEPFALVFDLGGRMLRVAKVADFTPAPYTVLGWEVKDIVTVVKELGNKGVNFERFAGMEQDALGVWTAPSGARIAWFKDPDGNVLSLTTF